MCDLKQLSEDKSKNFFDSEEGASGQNRLNRLSLPWRVVSALRWRANDGSKTFAVPHRTKMMWLRKSAILARGLQMTPLVLTFGGTPFLPSLLRQRRFLLSRVLPHPALPARESWHREPSPPPLDQGCLLLSTRNNTPITRARPLCLPIGLLGNSTFPKGPGNDWLGNLSVSGHPARMQQEY